MLRSSEATSRAITSSSMTHGPAMKNRGLESVMEDRKSTRLNSSHGYISYAVFCLKKTTHKRQRPCTVSVQRGVAAQTRTRRTACQHVSQFYSSTHAQLLVTPLLLSSFFF